MNFEIYNEPTPEWDKSIASRFPQMASMDLFDAFDVPMSMAADVKRAALTIKQQTGRRFAIFPKEKNEHGHPTTFQVKRVD